MPSVPLLADSVDVAVSIEKRRQAVPSFYAPPEHCLFVGKTSVLRSSHVTPTAKQWHTEKLLAAAALKLSRG
jgi:hypothetical protein